MKENPFDNGASGNISDKDKLIPIDYDGLMEKVEAANHIEPQTQGNVVENFKAKTNELFHEISEMNPAEIEEMGHSKQNSSANIVFHPMKNEIMQPGIMYMSTIIISARIHPMDIGHHLKRECRHDLVKTFPCKCYKKA